MKNTASLSVTGSRPTSSAGASRIHNYRHVGGTSFVDETLFASPSKIQDPEFDAPWAEKPKPRPLLFYTPSPSVTPRINSARSSCSSARSTKRRHIVTHKPSFVDESLFGPVPKGADFPAPWDKEKKVKPLLWYTPTSGNNVNEDMQTSSRNSSRLSRMNHFCDSSLASNHSKQHNHTYNKTKSVLTKKPVWR